MSVKSKLPEFLNMPSGGARARSGPPPDMNALRRDRKSDQSTWTSLPASREGPAPKWPLPTEPTRTELAQWRREWKRPQATEWERNGQFEEVAAYVRNLIVATSPNAPAPLQLLLLRQQENLGLSLTGLARHRWRIEAEAEPTTKRTDADPDRAAKKAQLRAIAGGAA